MINRIIIAAFAVVLVATATAANQPKDKVSIQVGKTSATNGKQMFASYCAPCHGVDGRGHGPTASALRAQPTDLTVLSKNNHGKFPDSHVVTVLQFGSEIPSHGSQEMPVWGPILTNMNRYNPQDKQLRISNLSRYLETIQVK
jgi:mono/diheme cytochrome c family protein